MKTSQTRATLRCRISSETKTAGGFSGPRALGLASRARWLDLVFCCGLLAVLAGGCDRPREGCPVASSHSSRSDIVRALAFEAPGWDDELTARLDPHGWLNVAVTRRLVRLQEQHVDLLGQTDTSALLQAMRAQSIDTPARLCAARLLLRQNHAEAQAFVGSILERGSPQAVENAVAVLLFHVHQDRPGVWAWTQLETLVSQWPGFGDKVYRTPLVTDSYGMICATFGTKRRADAVPLLLEAFTRNPDRKDVPWALGEIGDTTAIPTLLGALVADSTRGAAPALRTWVADALIKLGAREAVPPLVAYLQEVSQWYTRDEGRLPDGGDVYAAVLALARLWDTQSGHEAIVPILQWWAAHDRSADRTRFAATLAARRIRGEDGCLVLAEMLARTDSIAVRRLIVREFAAQGDGKAIGPLLDAAKKEVSQQTPPKIGILQECVKALEDIGGPSAISALRELSEHPRSKQVQIRWRADPYPVGIPFPPLSARVSLHEAVDTILAKMGAASTSRE